jgi:hypothetical protein
MEWHLTCFGKMLHCRVVIYAFLTRSSKLCALSSVDALYNKVEQKSIAFIFRSRQGEIIL